MSNSQFGNKILVVNGKFYAGENPVENVLVFSPERHEAVPIGEAGLKSVIKSVLGWVVDGEIELRRIEVLRA